MKTSRHTYDHIFDSMRNGVVESIAHFGIDQPILRVDVRDRSLVYRKKCPLQKSKSY